MTKRELARIAAVEFGRMGGKVKSERKAAAARKNGQKGGWPKGKKRNEQPVNLEPMDVKLGLYDSNGRKVSTGRVVNAETGATALSVPARLKAGATYRVRMSINLAKGKKRKGKR